MTKLLSNTSSAKSDIQSTFFNFSEKENGNQKKKRHFDRVFDYVITRICDGVYLPGSKINEIQISKELGLSIIPVRESMEKIVHIGLVERIPNKGVFVQKWSLKDLEDTYEMRLELEIGAICKIAKTITDLQLQQLHEVVELRKQADAVISREFAHILTHDLESYLKSLFSFREKPWNSKNINAEVQFHMLLIHFTGNRVRERIAELVLPRAIMSYQFHFYFLPYSTLAPLISDAIKRNLDPALQMISHENIYNALAAHDVAQAEQFMIDHLKFYYQINKAKIEVFSHLNSLNDILRNNKVAIG